MNWTFSTRVTVSDPHPLLDPLLDYAEVECKVHVECGIDPGFEGSDIDPPTHPEAHLEHAEVEEIKIHPIDQPDPDATLKALLLMTKEMREEIERLATNKVKRDWRREYQDQAFRTHHDFHMGWD